MASPASILMSRVPVATVCGVAGLLAYVAGAVTLFDYLPTVYPLWHALYFLIAGTLWVIPMKYLMYWAAHKL